MACVGYSVGLIFLLFLPSLGIFQFIIWVKMSKTLLTLISQTDVFQLLLLSNQQFKTPKPNEPSSAMINDKEKQ